MRQAFQADEVFTGNEMMADQVVITENNIITGILPKEFLPSGFEIQFFPDCLIAPAFIDLQLYGGNGKLFSNSLDIESLEATFAYCVSGGCTHFLITMATNSMENFLKGIDSAVDHDGSGCRRGEFRVRDLRGIAGCDTLWRRAECARTGRRTRRRAGV